MYLWVTESLWTCRCADAGMKMPADRCLMFLKKVQLL